jgi:branched-chain amino acid transport system ATP-binding protein
VLLEAKEIHAYYGLSHILFGISLGVKEGQLVCLLGRNGAGKSTTLRSIIGLVRVKKGTVIFNNRDIAGRQPYQIARLGIGFVPEERLIFPTLTVQENLEVGARVKLKKKQVKNQWSLAKIWEVFPKLESLKDRKGGYLSGGEQQMLTIARTLMGCPDLLLLDEPCEGLAPLIVKMMGQLIVGVCKMGNTILLAEQNVKFALDISEYGYIIENGTIRYAGSAPELAQNEEVKTKFLAVGKT